MSVTTHVRLLKYRRTKIVATVGPASNTPAVITQLINAGVNVFRLNMSHGDHQTHAESFRIIRETSDLLKMPVGILVDLSGPKIRTGNFEGGQIDILPGESIRITVKDVLGREGLIPSQYKDLAKDVKPGSRILLDDGAMELGVEEILDDDIECLVIHGGVLKNHKGINLPGTHVSAPSLTEKDRLDAKFALELGADFLALSFVRTANDIKELRDLINSEGKRAEIIAKIEKGEALDNAEAIIETADGIMVARGDLGVELPAEQVPVAQDQLINLAREKMKPVIVATQMLESMIKNPKPTRAEVTDVSHAVNGGADAIMLSAETAAGRYPVDAVKVMDKIARQTESQQWHSGVWGSLSTSLKEAQNMPKIVSNITAKMSRELAVRGVFVPSESHTTASVISSSRPAAPIVAIGQSEKDYRTFCLMWGVIPVLEEKVGSLNLIDLSRQKALELGLANFDDVILLVSGFSKDPKKNAPSVTVVTI